MEKIDAVVMQTATPTAKIVENIEINKRQGFSFIHELPEWIGRSVAVVGGGPSLKGQLDKLKTYDVIFACGSVFDFLRNNGVCVDYCVVVDPDPLVVNYMRSAFEEDGCKYLISSQCDPSVFRWAEQNNLHTFIWHAGGNGDVNFKPDDIVVGGGCTVGTRALIIAMCFGYKHIDLFGFDTCLDETDEHHAYKYDNPEVENLGPVLEIALDHESGKKFKIAEYMLGQLFDFKNILAQCGNTLELTVHGGGLIAELLRIGKEKQLALEKANGRPK